MEMNNKELGRFLEAQAVDYAVALQELQAGRKRSHWMWYIFPQLRGLGRSYNSSFYGIADIEEAAAYLNDPVLGNRLREISKVIIDLPVDNAVDVFGVIDSRKLKSSMTLFDIVAPDDVFARVLDKYFNGQRDRRTLELIR